MSIYDLTAYEVVREEDLSDLRSKGVLLRHKKSGARVLLMENDDETARRLQTAPVCPTSWSIRSCAVPGSSR